MDIDRRKRTFLKELSSLLLCSLLFLLLRVPSTFSSTLYFTNNDRDIDRLENNVITLIIEAESSLQALDCNSCDDRIYWTNGKEIRRSFPNVSNSTESVLDFGVTEPIGVAVDWRGSNVYFTDQINSDHGSVEVVTCDGKYRRVLYRNTFIEYKKAGPIVVDSHHGYIFFADTETCIWRANMDGSNPIKIINTVTDKIKDLAIDFNNSMLYWVDDGMILNSDYNGYNKGSISESVINSSVPSGVSIISGVLYWTQKETELSNGAIFSFALNSNTNVANVVSSNNSSVNHTINPHDISAFMSKEVIASVTGGCSDQNAKCSHFCFTIPNASNPLLVSSSVKCACRTGFALKNDNKTCVEVPLKFILVAEEKYISMLSFDIPEERFLLPLPIKSNGVVDYITYDRKNHFVYWTQRDPPAIWQSQFNGDNQRAIVTESIALPEGLVISDEGTNLYWTDSSIDKIEVVSLFHPDKNPLPRRTLINTDVYHPIGLAINESIGYIYWTDIAPETEGLVEKATKDGLSRTDIHSGNNLPGPITVDSRTGTLYWADSHPEKLGVWTLSGNGDAVNIVPLTGQYVTGLSVLDTTLYWTDRINGIVYSKRLDVLALDNIVADNLGKVTDITSVDGEQSLIDTDCSTDNGGCEDICVVSSIDNGRTCLCREHHMPDPNDNTKCIEERAPFAVASTNELVILINITDNNVHTLPIEARALSVDYDNQVLYWIGSKDGIIYKSDIVYSSPDATNYATTPITTCCYGHIADLVVDWWGRNLYWTDTDAGIIWVAKLNGDNKHVLIRGLDHPTHLLLNPYESSLYFVENNIKLYSIPMNGDGTDTLIYTSPFSMTDLTIDLVRQSIYFSSNRRIYEYDLISGGSQANQVWYPVEDPNIGIHDTHDHYPTYLMYLDDRVYAFYDGEGMVYYYDVEKKKGGIMGFVVVNMSSIVLSLVAMTFSHYSLQPDVHWCSTVTNGECEGDLSGPAPLCLVTNHYDRQCRCTQMEFLHLDYDIDREICRHTCTVTPAFLLLSTKSNVFHLSLRVPNNDTTNNNCNNVAPSPNELPFGDMGSIQAISYDPVFERIFWIDGVSDTINSINLAGNETLVLEKYDKLKAASMGYDWKSGTIVWTEDYATKISGVTHDGWGSGVLYKYEFSPANYWESIQLAVDSENGALYWSKSSDFSLHKIDLSSYESTRVNTGSLNKLQIKLLAFEPKNKILFWHNNYTSRIEGFDLSSDVEIIVTDVNPNDSISAMAATTISNHVCLFWYNVSDWSLYYYNMSSASVNIYSQLEEYTVILSIAPHDNEGFTTKSNKPCFSSTLDCSHFCSVSDSTSLCSCPLDRILLDNFNCSDLQCGELLSCSDGSNCYQNSSSCDGIKDCDDASDELNCSDNCGIGKTQCATVCISLDSLCLVNNSHCIQTDCDCVGEFYKCQSKCVPNSFTCGDCQDNSNCKYTSSSSSLATISMTPSSSSTIMPTDQTNPVWNSLIVSIVSVMGAILLIIAFAICAITLHCLITRRPKDIDIRHEVFSCKTTCSSSPQPSSPIMRSICTSDLSINTMVTGSTNVDKTSQEARFISLKRLSTLSTDPSNPPNSPITHRSVAFTLGDEVTIYSEFDPPIPRVPNPSLDYDAISEGISSVSQRKYPGVLPSNDIPTIDERHSESPPPPYYNHQMESMYGDDDSVDTAYKDFCPPIVPSMRYFNGVHLDDISETTFSMTINEISDVHDYPCDGYLHSDDPRSLVIEERRDHHGEEHFMHPYDRPPPPSPVTEYSIHGD